VADASATALSWFSYAAFLSIDCIERDDAIQRHPSNLTTTRCFDMSRRGSNMSTGKNPPPRIAPLDVSLHQEPR
jgi:hypothetical protein